MSEQIEQPIFDFSALPPKKKKNVVDDVRNILIVEFSGDKQGEQQAKQLFEELRERGFKLKIMT
jgi:hypothetical protein